MKIINAIESEYKHIIVKNDIQFKNSGMSGQILKCVNNFIFVDIFLINGIFSK